MRILFINPNITSSITEVMAAEARRSAAAGTELVPVTAAFGTLYVENRVEAAIAAHAILDACAAHSDGCDAVIIAAFGDPGLHAAKELLDMPVVGVAEAAFLAAYMLGNRYAIICLTPRLRTWYVETAHAHGLAGKLVAARVIPGPVPDITRAKDDLKEMLLAECLRAIAEDDAEVIIIGGGPVAGLAREIRDEIPVPLIDGVSAAVKLTEALVGLEPRPPLKGSFARPTPKPAQGLSPALMRRITGKDWFVAKDAVLVSDGRDGYGAFAHAENIVHIPIIDSCGEHVYEGFHIQNVNAYTSRLKDRFRPFKRDMGQSVPSH